MNVVLLMDKVLYICYTPYHAFISILKQYANFSIADILFDQDTPGVVDLVRRLKKEGVFDNVTALDDPRFHDGVSTVKDYYLVKFNGCRSATLARQLREYKEIYIFNDRKKIGYFLNRENIPYHLIEDGFDCFSVVDQHKPSGRFLKVKKMLHRVFDVPIGMGQGSNMIDVEVNNCSSLITSFSCHIVEKPRDELYQIPSRSQIKQLFRVFGAECLSSIEHESCIVLTDPLWETGVTNDAQENIELFLKMAKIFGIENCYIKPHPRDHAEYSLYFPQDRIIPAHLPIELLNYLGEGRFALAATWSSTAIYGLNCCRMKVVFDPKNKDSRVEHMSIRN